VNIDEKQHGLRKSTGVCGDPRPYNSSHIVQASQALGCVERIQGAPECRLFVADECFVREDLSVFKRDDRLIGDPERVERARQPHLEARAVSQGSIRQLEDRQRFALETRHHMQIAGAPDDIDERCRQDRLVDVAKRAVLHGLHRGLHVRTPGEDHYGDVEIVLARSAKKVQTAHAGHHQIGHDHVERLDRQSLRRKPRIAFRDDRPARARENLPVSRTHDVFVVHEQNPAAGLAHAVGYGLEGIGMEVRALERLRFCGEVGVRSGQGRPLRFGHAHRLPLVGGTRNRFVQMKHFASSALQGGGSNRRLRDIFRSDENVSVALGAPYPVGRCRRATH